MPNPVEDVITGKTALLNSITSYTRAYNNYQGCVNSPSGFNQTSCPSSTFTGSTQAFDDNGNLIKNGGTKTLQQLYTIVANYQSSIATNISNLNTNAVNPDTYNSLVAKRSVIDVELQNLYNTQKSIPNMYMENIDSTIYSGILWTVLATSLVYYIFTKL